MPELTKTGLILEGGVMDRRTVLQQSLVGGLVLAGAGLVAPLPAAAADDPGMMRVVVTGNNAEGKSYIVKDEVVKRGLVWSHTADQTLGPNGPNDLKTLLPTSAPFLDPPPGGGRWQFYSFPQSKRKKSDPIERSLGPSGTVSKDGFHRTATIDYDLIFGGEVTMYLDIGEVDLKTGDLVIQRNTSHAWHNYSPTPTTLLAMLLHM